MSRECFRSFKLVEGLYRFIDIDELGIVQSYVGSVISNEAKFVLEEKCKFTY